MIPYADNIPARRFPVMIPVWIFLGGWFLYQFFEGNWALLSNTGGSGVAFFAHVGGFVFGFVVTRLLIGAGRLAVEGTRWAAPA
jgi:membrane associated rhomboid family serine protease